MRLYLPMRSAPGRILQNLAGRRAGIMEERDPRHEMEGNGRLVRFLFHVGGRII